MTDEELNSLIDGEINNALGSYSGSISNEREKAMRYYMGEVDIASEEGNSQVVSTDIRDSIESILPTLIRIFTSTDKAVEFDSVGPEDEEATSQATAACNYVFYKQNNGFLILYTWLKDALLQKNGIVKYYWESGEKNKKEKYEGLDDIELQFLISKPNVQVLEHEAVNGGHNVLIQVNDSFEKICIVNVPPEEFLITARQNSVSLQDCSFVAHRSKKTLSDLREMGFDVNDDIWGDDQVEYSSEYIARRRNEDNFVNYDENSDPASRHVWVSECYVRVDYDGDGITELRKVIKAGSRILKYKDGRVANQETDHIPFAAYTPMILPHRFFGLSIADILFDIQDQKSVIWRKMLDSLYLSVNPRIAVHENMVNLDDLLTSRAGGVVRMKGPPGAVWAPLETRFVGQQAFPMVEYMDSVKENRSGVTRYNQGSDSDSLNKTAHGINAIMNASQQRIELMARIFAETGLKELFKGILHMLTKYSSKEMMFRMRNKYVHMDPRAWDEQWDMTINVGLGTGNKDQTLAHLSAIGNAQKELLIGGKSHMVTDKNIYNTFSKLVENSGFHPEEFITNPDTVPPPPQQPSPEQIKAQAEMQIKQLEIQQKDSQAKMEAITKGEIAKLQAEVDLQKAGIAASADTKKAEATITSSEIRAQAVMKSSAINAIGQHSPIEYMPNDPEDMSPLHDKIKQLETGMQSKKVKIKGTFNNKPFELTKEG